MQHNKKVDLSGLIEIPTETILFWELCAVVPAKKMPPIEEISGLR
jgi:hypothetical protein